MTHAQIKKQQAIVRKAIFRIGTKRPYNGSGVLGEIFTNPSVEALGKTGDVLLECAQRYDLRHPDILDVFGRNSEEVSCTLSEYLKLCRLASEHGITRVSPTISKFILKDIHKISSVRLLADFQARIQARSSKSVRNVDLRSFMNKGQHAWDSLPSDFMTYIRFSKSFENEIKKAQSKASRFSELGCISLAEEIEKDIRKYKDRVDESSYGFHRITMTNASVILAKMHGFSTVLSLGNDRPGIVIPKDFFDQVVFDVSQRSLGYSTRIHYGYATRAYPIHDLIHISPDYIADMIDHLESFPAAHNKPIFDHYIFLVPTVDFPEKVASMGFVHTHQTVDEDGELRHHQRKQDAQLDIDIRLIKAKKIVPILLGERDGKCYFLSYWI